MTDYSITNGSYQNVPVEIRNEEILPETQILLKVDFRMWGDSVKADKGEMIIDSNKELLSLQKTLITCKEYDVVKGLTKQIGKQILRIGLPASKSFRAGFYRVPLDSIGDMDALLERMRDRFNEAVSDFLSEYWNAVARAERPKDEGGLGVLFRANDYPSLNELRDKFSFTWQFISFSVPQNLPLAIRQREAENFRQSLLAARSECMEALRQGFAALIDRATERLKERTDGKRLKFQESLTSQMIEFLDSFSARNSIGNDEQLAQLVEKAKRIMEDCPDLKDLKDPSNETARARIQARFAEIQSEIETTNLVPRKGRAMQVTEDAIAD